MAKKTICAYCGGTAELLCDYRIGWERLRTKMEKEAPNLLVLPGHDVPIRYRHVHTCDTPLCHACVHNSGTIFVCLRGSGGFHDSIDYCPNHAVRHDGLREISGLAARAWRGQWLANALSRWQKQKPMGIQESLF